MIQHEIPIVNDTRPIKTETHPLLKNAIVIPPLDARAWTDKEVPPMFVTPWGNIARDIKEISVIGQGQKYVNVQGEGKKVENEKNEWRYEAKIVDIPESFKTFFNNADVTAYWITSGQMSDNVEQSLYLQGTPEEQTLCKGDADTLKRIQLKFYHGAINDWQVTELDRAQNGDLAIRKLTPLKLNGKLSGTIADKVSMYQQTGEEEKRIKTADGRIVDPKETKVIQGLQTQFPLWREVSRTTHIPGSQEQIEASTDVVEKFHLFNNEDVSPKKSFSVFARSENKASSIHKKSIETGDTFRHPKTDYPIEYIKGFMPSDTSLFKAA